MQRDYQAWHSHHLNRPMEFLWFGWSGRPVMLFPTSGGRSSENEDFSLVGALAGKVEAGEIQLICVDSVDNESWYNRWAHPADRVRRHEQYDRYLRHELVPYIGHRAVRGDLVVYGASFGAYHAANFAARYPEVVSQAICFSGLYDIHRYLDGYWDDACYFHCPTAYIPNMGEHDTARLSRVGWVIATGEHDSLVNENRHFAGILASRGIPHHAEFWSGVFGHDWPWWKQHLPRFL
jgi:esterase/lipase superfamily enzyme